MGLLGITRRLVAAGSAFACVLAGGTALAGAPSHATSLASADSLLLAHSIPAKTVKALGDQAAVLAQLLASGSLAPAKVETAASSLLTVLRTHDGGRPQPRPAALPPIGDCASGGGASYDVFTNNTGFTVESGTVTLGTTLNANPRNDAFYASLGAYTGAGSVDVGIWSGGTGSNADSWYAYANGTLTHWAYGSFQFSQSQDPKVLLSVLVGTNSLTLDAFNAQSDAAIGSSSFSESGYGFGSSGGGVGFYRFDSLAQNSENLADGSSLTGQAWSDVAATPTGSSAEMVNPGIVSIAGPECSKPEQRTVHVLSQTKWYASDVSIHYTNGSGGKGGKK